jgi:hypothetical protein
MSHPSLKIAAARFALGLATTDELIDAAHDALNDSVYSYSLGELATFRQPTRADIDPLFAAALRELEMPMPSREEAAHTLLSIHAGAIAEGAVAPHEGVYELYEIYTSLGYSSRRGPELELEETLRELAYRHYEYVDSHYYRGLLPEEEFLRQLDERCIRLATAWCRARWRSRLDPAWRTSTVVALARGIDEEKAFDRLPILADALQDAGCDNDDLLEHCRGRGVHVRGCWVVDLVLGKE